MIAVGGSYGEGLVAVPADGDKCVGCSFLADGDCTNPRHSQDCSGESYVIFVPLLVEAAAHTL